ncbi:DUF222 domain-containing protein [Microbacterium hydrocarbonoxydans]|uniref:HNH endonuclease n=1 Tax=Microbacterium hydrocarbonoxydans TaxID=273678 RepID=UPI003D980B1F
MPNPHLSPLLEAVASLEEAWADAECGTDLSRTQLLAVNAAIGTVQRCFDGIRAEVAAGIDHESRSELGADSLAKQQGFRSSSSMIAATNGGSMGEAAKLAKLGKATAPRSNLLGERLPAKYPAVQAALAQGAIGAGAAALIVAMLDRARLRAGAERIAEAEALLVGSAAGLSVDDVRKLVTHAEAWLDPDGTRPREDEARANRSLTMFERDGSFFLDLRTDIASGAPIKAAIQAWVTATFQARTTAPHPDAADADHRSVAMIQADALTAICEHVADCDNGGLPMSGATVVVRVSLDDLTAGTGTATIDGVDHPISVSACRRMAASGGVIPAVLGATSEILDWGREKRLFTRAQRLALVERDGGCVMCGLPPEMTKAHHLRWWARDAGPTDLGNGVLLCESCHHRVHDNGWGIRVDGTSRRSKVWIIPPANIDPQRTPRLGGRARYDIAA